MDTDELRQALRDRAALAPAFMADPDALMRREKQSHRRRTAVTAAVAGAVVVAATVSGLLVATRSTSGSPATIIPATATPSPAQSAPIYCEPPSIAQCEAAHPVPQASDRPGYGTQLLGLPIRIPITHTGRYRYSVPVSGIRPGYNSFAAGFRIAPMQDAAALGRVEIAPHDSSGTFGSVDISVEVRSYSGHPAMIIENMQVENVDAAAPVTATVRGTLRMTGGPAGAAAQAVAGSVFFTPANGGDRLTTTAGPDGSFAIALPPGTYTVTGTSPDFNGGQGVCRAGLRSLRSSVVVPASGLPGLDVNCDRR